MRRRAGASRGERCSSCVLYFCFIYQPVCLFVAKGCRAAASHCVFISEQLQPVAGRSPAAFMLPAYLSVCHSENMSEDHQRNCAGFFFFLISSTSFIICSFPDLFDMLLTANSTHSNKDSSVCARLRGESCLLVATSFLCDFKGTAHPKTEHLLAEEQ